MARIVKWTESATSDLEKVAEFISRDSRFYATAVVREARKAARSLRVSAERGRIVPKRSSSDIRELFLTECPFEDLRNPKRVHIDSFGIVHLCQGLSMGNMWEIPLSDLVNNYDPDAHPICGPLLKGGSAQLVKEYNVQHVPR